MVAVIFPQFSLLYASNWWTIINPALLLFFWLVTLSDFLPFNYFLFDVVVLIILLNNIFPGITY